MKDISLYEFNALEEHEKGEALWELGTFVMHRFEGGIGYSLYELKYFYVEVEYNGDQNKISKFTSFCTYTKLDPYVGQIDLSWI